MSDELYFGPPNGHRGRHERRSSDHPYFDDVGDEYDEHGPLAGESLNETPRRRPLNVENLRRLMRDRNPHGE